MKKKTLLGLGLCTLLLMALAGCTQQNENGETIDPTIKAIQDAGKLVVGTNAEYAPWEYVENGEFVGFDMDLAQYIADHFGVDLEIKNMSFDASIFTAALNNDEVDLVIAALTINDERSELMAFSNPYFSEGQVIIVNVSNNNISGPEDLLNVTVGVQNGTTSQDAAVEYTGNETYVALYENYEQAKADLIAGEIEAIVIDNRAGEDLVMGEINLQIVGNPFTVEYYAIALKKGEAALKTEINDVIAELQSTGILDELEETWLS
ncbi:MAG: amino acid ABC transporter substrate-binding protein [Candidatus Thermoplasmatota archaeon]|nr:amino acid ABC transporter substrate-binding protein [Candidatus Thermoplasmatota archaeon]